MLINRGLQNQVAGEFYFAVTCLDTKKCPFMTTTNGIVSAVPWSVNYFCSEFPDIPEKSGRRKKTDSKAITKRYALHKQTQ